MPRCEIERFVHDNYPDAPRCREECRNTGNCKLLEYIPSDDSKSYLDPIGNGFVRVNLELNTEAARGID